ncbi:type I phosphodiesterase/nucleotide pyrophosphatase [Desulfotomaculum nigrificans CO-1-SRB]|uniref:Type I phosphodiesterase/nucleotide pyrophosphatase n=1 Tax=Desulfotomaculum nigrificans (strain DSM 14880 / VKM B-2319 / CO-1-SRB) TaxID=868595 RepID=F6B4L7_DESCC|nr:alkaline phosphatase family protein [Desulfotomaculum nigrificans]AEF94129.1 type I phosphodiesterase/nucleotide pyrophosphatase [Desulfotomaculum nigrificans CO-1-SRB]
MPPQPKTVIYMIIDSFHPRALRHCLGQGKLPALSYLIQQGHLDEQCVSVFPTITPVCTSTLTTGAPPAGHGIPGIIWYHRGERRIVDYGANWWSIWKNGLVQTCQDMIFNLNHKHLSWQVRTIYEELEARGLNTAAVNPIIFRANTRYEVHIPLLLKLITLFQVDNGKVYGPQGFCLGRLYQPPGALRQDIKNMRFGAKLGFNDNFSAVVAQWFLRQKPRANLLTIYFPDMDSTAHAKNPDCCEPCLTKIDQKIAAVLDCFPSWSGALEENVFVLVGDHGQSALKRRGKTIKLPRLLKNYSQAKLGENPVEDKDIAICSNERVAYIYIIRHRPGMRKDIVRHLLTEPRIDQIIWREDQWYHVQQPGKNKLSFCKGDKYTDIYGQSWQITGDPKSLDLQLDGNYITYGQYPNALARIADCLDNPHAGDMVITAKPGYLLGGEGAPPFPGAGSHGSLHREDSLVPLIISGTSAKIEKPRLVDVMPFICSLFHPQG